jgi:hypothetical protein
VGIHERGESRYQMRLHLEPPDQWRRLAKGIGTSKIADDSHDENRRLDFDETHLRQCFRSYPRRRTRIGGSGRFGSRRP